MCTDFMGVWTGKWVAGVAFRPVRVGRRCLESGNEVAEKGVADVWAKSGCFFYFWRL